ncbi:hypothetical protein V6N13_142477 [Hibiscus sabdariffa]
MSEFSNTHSFLPPRRYKDVGNRPPDGVPYVPISPTLERPTSPIPFEGQSELKMTRSHGGIEEVHDFMVLDAGLVATANGLADTTGVEESRDKIGTGNPPKDGTTYASKVEICLQTEGKDSGVLADKTTSVDGNEAYLVSNPDNKSKSRNKAATKVDVIPTVEGQITDVIPHKPNVASGSHSAIKIVEAGQGDGNHSKIPLKGIARRGKGPKEGLRNVLTVKKPVELTVKKSHVADWVHSAQLCVDLIEQEAGVDDRGIQGSSHTTPILCSESDDDGLWDSSHMEDMSDGVASLEKDMEGNH